MKYYLEIIGNEFGFLVDAVHDIPPSAIPISTDEYKNYFKLTSEGKQFRVKKQATGSRLFDYIEEYIPEFNIEPQPPSEIDLLKEEVLQQSEATLDLDFRLTSLELGL